MSNTQAERDPPARSIERGYDLRDVNVRLILIIMGVGSVLIIVSVIGLLFLRQLYVAAGVDVPEPAASEVFTEPLQPAAPRLEEFPERLLPEHLEEERALLEGYGWIDRENGVARIPIKEAIEITAERGWRAER